MLAEHVTKVAQTRNIEDVLHFTRLERLPIILEYGLRTRGELISTGLYPTDADRLDERDDAVSVSISCYCPRMFEGKRYRAGRTPWAILVLQPRVLWDYHCLFFRRSAAKNDSKYENGKRFGGFALDKLFEDCSLEMDPTKTGFRAKHGLPQSWPTFSDSEVQVISPIHPGFIRGVWVETNEQGNFARAAFNAAGREDCQVRVHPFEPRINSKPYYWG